MDKPRNNYTVLFIHQGAELYGSDYIFYMVVKNSAKYIKPIVILDSEGPLVDKIKSITKEVYIFELGVLRRKYFNLIGVAICIAKIINAAFKIKKIIRKKQCGAVYTNTIGVIPGMLAARISSTPHICHVHEIMEKPKLVGRILSTFAQCMSVKVVAVSNPVKEFMEKYSFIRKNNVEVVHNGIATDKFDNCKKGAVRKEFNIGEEEFLIAMVGRIHFWKGQDLLIEAANTMRKRGVNTFKILFFGDVFEGYEDCLDTLRSKVQDYGLRDRVVFCGYRNDAERLFVDADVVVLPSVLPDPLPTVVLEAMAARKPVIATRHGGALEMVAHDESGFLVSPKDPADMAERIIQLYHDNDLKVRMGEAGRKRMQMKFSEKRFLADIARIIQKLIA